MTGRRVLLYVLSLAPAGLVGGAIAASPTPAGAWTYPLGQRLLYVHVPLAWGAYVGFLAAAIAAGIVLARGSPAPAAWMRASLEATTVYAIAALASGLAWSYEFPLYDPLADPKVLTTLVLALAAGGLVTLASSARPARRDDLVAALTMVAVLAVPASYFASRLSVHPEFARTFSIDATMGTLLALATLGATMLGAAIVWTRTRQLRLEEAIGW